MAPVLVHLDTDLGGDPDDVCALAFLLGRPEVELAAVTTTIDPGGARAACVLHCLDLVGRSDVPVVAGAGATLTDVRAIELYRECWPDDLSTEPARPGAALDALEASIDHRAAVIAIGPYTNLAQLEVARPGSLARASITVMGGWVDPPAEGLPRWGPEDDWNVQADRHAAAIVAEAAARLMLATLPATMRAHLRGRDLERLRASGPLGRLIAAQSERHARDHRRAEIEGGYPAVPDDFLNFHYDPVACAVALGWGGVTVEEMPLSTGWEAETFRWRRDPAGRPTRVLVDVDAERFSETWLTSVEAAQAR